MPKSKAAKSTKKFVKSGQLKKTIESRKKYKEIKKKVESRRGARSKTHQNGKKGPGQEPEDVEMDEEESAGEEEVVLRQKGENTMTVDDLLEGFGMNDEEEDEEDDDEDDIDDLEDLELGDDTGNDVQSHKAALAKLAAADPEFYAYLKENDGELLNFGSDDDQDITMNEDEDEDEDEGREDSGENAVKEKILTRKMVRTWREALEKNHSLRTLRKVVLVFRSLVEDTDDAPDMKGKGKGKRKQRKSNSGMSWRTEETEIHSSLINLALKHAPMVIEVHLSSRKKGKQTAKYKSLQKIVHVYFRVLVTLLEGRSGSDDEGDEHTKQILHAAARVLPYVGSLRQLLKSFTRVLLQLWSSATSFGVRMGSFVAVRRLLGADRDTQGVGMVEWIFKNAYLTLIRASASPNAHTLPAVTFMKNSAAEVFCSEHAATTAYQVAFGYIRQLAIQLRNSMKTKTKDSFMQVYNWQYVHAVDFWSLVISKSEDLAQERKQESSELRQLIYPLTQVSLGAVRLIPNSRSYPFHLHILRSLLHLGKHTRTYIPIAPYVIPIITNPMAQGWNGASTMKPVDMESVIRAGNSYVRTRIYRAGCVEEGVELLGEWIQSREVHGSVAFSEIIWPIIAALKKVIKSSKIKGGKEIDMIKTLVERIEESIKWMNAKRSKLELTPGEIARVHDWEDRELGDDQLAKTPLGKYVAVLKKTRNRRREIAEKARQGEHEIIHEDELSEEGDDENEEDEDGGDSEED